MKKTTPRARSPLTKVPQSWVEETILSTLHDIQTGLNKEIPELRESLAKLTHNLAAFDTKIKEQEKRLSAMEERLKRAQETVDDVNQSLRKVLETMMELFKKSRDGEA